MSIKKITPPLDDKTLKPLKAGMKVLISGAIYSARDKAHQKICDFIKNKKKPPFNLKGQIIYYTGPCPAPKGKVIGSAGPTTSSRMDSFTLPLLAHGLKAMIGKGKRSLEIIKAVKKHKAVYFAAVGGAGAYLSKCILSAEVLLYPELGAEAVYKLEVKDFPAIVAIDTSGKSIYTN